MLPYPFQFNVHIRLVILSHAISDIACFSFTSLIKFITLGGRAGLVLAVGAIFETEEEFTSRNEK
jgi:hypothetical protein